MSETKEKKTDYLVLVNEDNRLPDEFEHTVDWILVENSVGDTYQIERKTYEAFMRLREELLNNDGIQTELISVYRTIKQQEETFERYLKQFGFEYASKYVAKPGCSEHHTGIAIDVGIVVEGKLYRTQPDLFDVDDLFQIVQAKLPAYGFIVRYPKGKESVTKIGYEPWHYRYVDSPEIAKEITETGICLEEYWNSKKSS